jgi:tRNA(adenine34) deaminase
MLDHHRYLELAIAQAEIALTEGSTPVGGVLVDADGEVVAVSRNQSAPLGDPTAHAETQAIRAGGVALMPRSLVPAPGARDYTLYTTGEPCLMCVGLVLLSPIDTLVWAAGPIVLGGSAWDAIAGSGWNAARFEKITVIREPDPEIRLRSRKLLYDFLTARGDHARAAIVYDPPTAGAG